MPRDESFPSLESRLAMTLKRLTELQLVDFTKGLWKPVKQTYELKEYFYAVKDLFTEDPKGDGNLRIPHEVVQAIQNYTDTRIHT